MSAYSDLVRAVRSIMLDSRDEEDKYDLIVSAFEEQRSEKYFGLFISLLIDEEEDDGEDDGDDDPDGGQPMIPIAA